MRKILLIIAIVFCIFQMVVLAVDINIGSPAIDRATATTTATLIEGANAANATGKITSVEIWSKIGNDLVNCEVATFYSTGENEFSTRDIQYIGAVISGSKQIFEVDLDVQIGDYIGIYFSAGQIELAISGGTCIWYIDAEDNIPCTTTVFTLGSSWVISLCGTGATIDIGLAASDRGTYLSTINFTCVEKSNPANASGKITSVEIFAQTTYDLTDCVVATFYIVSGDNLSTRDYEAIGTVTAGSKQTFPVDLDVEEGDHIGLYASGGRIECDSSGLVGVWGKSGDYIPCADILFSFLSGYGISLYGTGETIVWDHEWNTKTISKWNTKEFTKWNGLE